MSSAAPAVPAPAKKFGTFIGVYIPSVLTILGVMMYLRFGWVVGNTGLPIAALLVLMASSITFITGLSASAIATNMRVGVGGEYFMVSRSLGLELGGAIGIPLFLCRTLSLTLYAFGLAEAVAFLWPAAWGTPPVQWLAAATIVLVTALAGKSADVSLKLQVPIMIAVGLSVLALIIGVLTGGMREPEMVPHYERSAPAGFWYVFAVFFPAVTGFTAGIGMSGDLKDPKRSIPKGTMLAVITGALVYLGIVGFLAVTTRVSPAELAALDPEAPPVWTKIALLGAWLVFPGMFGAILSSAFGSALGGPRVLQALGSDGLAPRFLARTSRTGQPTIATWVTGAIALAAVGLGDLNAVGRWVTIFFLTLYVTINLSAALEKLVGDPSYRPTIRVPWPVSLLGSAAAVVVMFLISPVACVAAVLLEGVLYLVLRRRALESRWGDVRAGLWTALARFSLLQLRKLSARARNWRPRILVFTHNPARRIGLVRLASWFSQDRGVVTVCRVVQGDPEQRFAELETQRAEMARTLEDQGVAAFVEAHVVPDLETGILGIAQANGIAGLESNTVVFGWSEQAAGLASQLRLMRLLAQLRLSTILVHTTDLEAPRRMRTVDIWWGGLENNGDLMLLLAHLLHLNAEWRQARLRVRSIVAAEAEREQMGRKLRAMMDEVRIEAEADVLVKPEDQSLRQVMHAASRDADLVFLGLKIPAPGEEPAYVEQLNALAAGFSLALFVRNAEPFAGKMLGEEASRVQEQE
jgi:amino acid transporter